MATRRTAKKMTKRKTATKVAPKKPLLAPYEDNIYMLSGSDIDRIADRAIARNSRTTAPDMGGEAPVNVCLAGTPFETFGLEKDSPVRRDYGGNVAGAGPRSGPRVAIEEGWTNNSALHCMLDDLEKRLDPILVPQPEGKAVDPSPGTVNTTELMNMLDTLLVGQTRLQNRLQNLLSRIVL